MRVGVERGSFVLLIEDIYEERIARYLELAEAAQEAAGRTHSPSLQETYAQIARQWLHLAQLAAGTIDLARQVSAPLHGDGQEPLAHPAS